MGQPLKSQMIDYDAARAKVKKLVEKPSEDPTKLPRVGPTLRCGCGCSGSLQCVRGSTDGHGRPKRSTTKRGTFTTS